MPDGYSRPDKETHADTVLYEIEMLAFAKAHLEKASTKGEQWAYLEDFLLHYRNLIEFFGKPKPRDGDLSVCRPDSIWQGAIPEDELRRMRTPELWEAYDSGDNNESISKYLHHCTQQRREPRRPWPVDAMYQALKPAMDAFKAKVPPYALPLNERLEDRRIHQSSTYSTATVKIIGPLIPPDE
jgi:hypothetical protein